MIHPNPNFGATQFFICNQQQQQQPPPPLPTLSRTRMTNSKQVLQLYKQLLNKAYKFDNYNFREYTKRKVHDTFKANKGVSNQEEVSKLYNEGINQLALLTRQTTISQLYTFDKLVIEPLNKHH